MIIKSIMSLFKKKSFSKKDIDDILKSSKTDNRKYLYDVMSIRNISSFDVSYIMSRLNLTSEKIKLIKVAASQYNDKNEDSETYSSYIFRIIKKLELLEKDSTGLLNELKKCRDDINNLNSFVKNLVNTPTYNIVKPKEEFVFSKIYIDK